MINNFKEDVERIENWLELKADLFLNWTKQYSPIGFGGVALYDAIRFIYIEMMRDNITTRANAVAYSLFIAIFPFIIFLFTLLPYLPVTADYITLLSDYISKALPTTASIYLVDIIKDLVSDQHGDLRSFGIFLTIFFASNGLLTLMYGFDKAESERFTNRGYFKIRMIAIGLTLVLSILFVSSFVLLVLGNTILTQLQDFLVIETWMIGIIRIIKYLVAVFLLYIGIGIIYKYGPSFKKRLPLFTTGATIATLLSLLISFLFSYYVNNFGRYNEIYGSIGALIIVLIWLQFNAMAILIGFEFNASIVINRASKKTELKIKDKIDLEEIDPPKL